MYVKYDKYTQLNGSSNVVLRFQDVYFGSEHGSFCHAPFLFSDVMKSLYIKMEG